jgi:hypothetical protein
MAEQEEFGHEPDETHDRRFAPVTRGSDAEGHTTPLDDEEKREPQDKRSGTGVPGAEGGHPDELSPDEEGVRQAEQQDDSR